jgi:integrase
MKWILSKEKQRGVDRPVIRRWVDGKLERMPVAKYRRIRDDYSALEEFVKRQNAPLELRQKVDYKHAFINDALLTDYYEDLLTDIPTEESAKTDLGYLKNYFLHYFLTLKQVTNPTQWIEYEKKWIAYLLKDPEGPSELGLKGVRAETTKRKVINAANRFLLWLHKKRPEEMPKVQFESISKARFKEIKAQRKLNGETNDHVYIPKDDLAKIMKALPSPLDPFVKLMISYGLRHREAMGVLPGDVKKGHLFVQRQLKNLGQHRPLKGRKPRKVPHWFCSAKEAYAWIELVQTHMAHPRTVYSQWVDLMQSLGFTYTFHDLRHTWTTDAMRSFGVKAPRDVQLAAGHESLATTMKYLHDDRDMSDEDFSPDDAA